MSLGTDNSLIDVHIISELHQENICTQLCGSHGVLFDTSFHYQVSSKMRKSGVPEGPAARQYDI